MTGPGGPEDLEHAEDDEPHGHEGSEHDERFLGQHRITVDH
jgi:hypothetical protein